MIGVVLWTYNLVIPLGSVKEAASPAYILERRSRSYPLRCLPTKFPSGLHVESAQSKSHHHDQVNFNLAEFLEGDWQLEKSISYSKLFHELSKSEGTGAFSGTARFVLVRPPIGGVNELWYKEEGQLKMGNLLTVISVF